MPPPLPHLSTLLEGPPDQRPVMEWLTHGSARDHRDNRTLPGPIWFTEMKER